MTTPALPKPCTHEGWGMHLTVRRPGTKEWIEVELDFPDLDSWWAMFDFLKESGGITTWRKAAFV